MKTTNYEGGMQQALDDNFVDNVLGMDNHCCICKKVTWKDNVCPDCQKLFEPQDNAPGS
jgi:hypothetical protein